MSVIGEAALSAFFQALFEKIASSDLLKFVTEKEVLAEIKKWKKMLIKIHEVLDDAEEKQMTQQSVKDWLSELKDLAYDVEDVLDEFTTESLRRKLEGEPEASTSKVRKLIPSCCTNFSPRAFVFNSKMDSKIKEITARLQEITDQKNDLGLFEIVGRSSNESWQRPPTTCLHDEPKVYGRDEDRRKILDFLFRDDATDEKVGVLPIVGMGGLGKTTLARFVYNHESLQQHFHLKAWVCVSDDYDLLRISKGILESITSKPCDMKELNQVQVELQNELSGKRFLIVLDDVWSESYDDWNALRPPFMDGAPGCKIIVTTRSEVVARNMGNVNSHTLQYICDDDCWLLFSRHAFDNRSTVTQRNLEVIREKVTSKCAGLPLAARTLGGLLRSKPRDKWEDVLNSKIWRLEGGKRGILPVLRLSYYYLPSHLKRCFSYCAIFPKDYEFTEMEVVLLWMAEGLIQQVSYDKQIEDVGSEYFHDLLSRSLFQAAPRGGSKYVMHDLVNDLAQNIAGEICFRLEDVAFVGEQLKRERVRHSSYICGEYDGIKKFQPFHGIPHLRTFLPLSLRVVTDSDNYLTRGVLSDLLPKLRPLRVLSFKGYEIFELPDLIGELKHLRYFDLSFTKIRRLPESTILLINLQTFLLRGCKNLKKLPSEIEKLINLRHLDIERAGLEDGLPLGIKELVSLRRLCGFPVSKVSGAGVTALKNLKFLQGELCISKLENVADVLHGWEANLKEKKDLLVLLLKWKEGHIGDERFDKELLGGLQPHVELEKLVVGYYGGISFPVWVGDPSFHKLAVLTLYGCWKCTSLPKLGLLSSLRDLVIRGMHSVKSVGCEFYGEGCSNPFPSLERLEFTAMEEWEDWDPCGFEFPCLHELKIWMCPKLLGKLPNCLSKLKKLCILDCKEFIVSLPSLPMLSELEINLCKEVNFRNMVEFGSPNKVILIGFSKFTFKTEELIMEQLMTSKSLTLRGEFLKSSAHLQNFSSNMAEEEKRMVHLEELVLRNCESFVRWDHMFMSVRHLTVESSPKLVSFEGVAFPSTLRVIKISNCNALASLPNAVGLEDLHITKCDSLISIGRNQLPSTVKRLVVELCNNLESLLVVDVEQSSSSSVSNLEFLSIKKCSSLMFLSSAASGGKLPPSLKHLEIESCSELEFIAESFNTALSSSSRPCHLEFLSVTCCNSLTCLTSSRGELPPGLKHLEISFCSKLESIVESFNSAFSSLESIRISYCDNLRYLPKNLHKLIRPHEIFIRHCESLLSFPEGGLPTTTYLKKFIVTDCQNIEALPDNIHSITSLQNLVIDAGMVSFPEGGLPTNLTELHISNLINCRPMFEWGLHRLTSLTSLYIKGGCPDIVSFPCDDMGMMLPSSLIQLSIVDFPKLEYLSTKGFQNLTSLEYLSIHYCPELALFPKEGLPLSLVRLYIRGCPLLEQRCHKYKEQDWFKIAYIPWVIIGGRSVFNPDESRPRSGR